MVRGHCKEGLPPTGTFLWVDVHDVALAHVRAIEVPEAGGQRFFLTAGHFSNKAVADIIREAYPELADKLPPKDSPDDTPADVYGFNNKKSIEVLGIQYRSLKQSVTETVKSLLAVGA